MKKILVRFDDLCPTMDFKNFQIAIQELDSRNIKPLVGVIPCCADPDLNIEEPHEDFWVFIKKLQMNGYTIAMHGYKHVFDNHCRGTIVTRNDSEFAGHSLEVQIEKIRKGKDILESHGIFTDVFFAPGHSYDDNTLKALAACGFKYMSDGKSFCAYTKYGIKCLPCRSGGVPKMRVGTYHTAVFHAHEWAWEQKKKCYYQFLELINNKDVGIINFNSFSNQPVGNTTFQLLIETIYVFNERYMRPILSKTKRIL